MRPELSAKWMLSILSDLPLTRKTVKNVYFSILQIFERWKQPKHQFCQIAKCQIIFLVYVIANFIIHLGKKTLLSAWGRSRDSTAKRNLLKDMSQYDLWHYHPNLLVSRIKALEITLQVQIMQCTKKLAIQFKLDCTHPPEFFAFFLREKSWHSNQTNGILSSIDRKSLRDSNKWTSVGPGSFHMKKKQCGPEPIISNLKMVFCIKKYSDYCEKKLL